MYIREQVKLKKKQDRQERTQKYIEVECTRLSQVELTLNKTLIEMMTVKELDNQLCLYKQRNTIEPKQILISGKKSEKIKRVLWLIDKYTLRDDVEQEAVALVLVEMLANTQSSSNAMMFSITPEPIVSSCL